ncbi:MAG: histidine kinase [Clostridiales bacterium]|nr:histidine kinase [Clostridiales bacterium]
MRLSTKLILILSAMMLSALLVLSNYAANTSVMGANAFTEARFHNMAVSIYRDIQQDYSMMQLTLEELTSNSTLMAALNQMIRDDSDDQKMAKAAEKAALQQLIQSPLVDGYQRVTFYTRDGVFLTVPPDKDISLTYGSPQAAQTISAFPWLDKADASDSFCVLAPHRDFFSRRQDAMVYGIVQKVSYHGKEIGYLEIAKGADQLNRIMDFVDNDVVLVQVYQESGALLFSSTGESLDWPDTLAQNEYTRITPENCETEYLVYHTLMERGGLHLVIAQDAHLQDMQNYGLRRNMFLRALYIMIPTGLLISLVSLGLTRSTRKLTRKVRQIPISSMLKTSPGALSELAETVTSPTDKETHELEQVFNAMMLHLREAASAEMALREGALQARLSALQTQINPHFIYNTLNIISAKSMESGNFDVIEICNQFAQMLRYSTDTRSQTATMAEEIEFVRSYLMLAKARYEDNLEFSIDVPENLGDITVPRLTLQPLVENALNHGFDGKNVLRRLSVSGHIEDGLLVLIIRDNGTGFSGEMLQSLRSRIRAIEEGTVSIESTGGHIGLINTCLRLHYYSKGAMRIAIGNDNGAVITLTMPCSAEKQPGSE